MNRNKESREKLDEKILAMQQQVEQLEKSLLVQKQIAYASGIFQQDVTVRTMLEAIAETVVVCDPNGMIVVVNKRAKQLFGFDSQELIGRSLNTLIPGRFMEIHTRHVEHFFGNPHLRPMGIGLELTGRRKDGTEFPIEVSLSYLETELGTLGLAFVTDISLRKEAEHALKLRNEELDAFAHTVAHDLKASMSTIIGYSEALAETHRTLSAEELDEYLLGLARSGRRMNNIIDELLVFSSIRKEEVSMKLIDMKAVVDNVLERLHLFIREKEAQVIVAEQMEDALGHAQWVEEVWFNYITNAINYGASPALVEIGSQLQDDFVEYWVQDNGPGVDPAIRPMIFQAYAKTEVERVHGYGLGLSIVKRIVEKLDGQVNFVSSPEHGSRFSFFLQRSGR